MLVDYENYRLLIRNLYACLSYLVVLNKETVQNLARFEMFTEMAIKSIKMHHQTGGPLLMKRPKRNDANRLIFYPVNQVFPCTW